MISLMDSMYKTTKYEVILFFVTVKTNVGYSVVAEFVVLSETKENISEALAKYCVILEPKMESTIFYD